MQYPGIYRLVRDILDKKPHDIDALKAVAEGVNKLRNAEQRAATVRGFVADLLPHIAGGRCYFAGDDGYAYCLDAATGRLIWEKRLAFDGRMLPGNGPRPRRSVSSRSGTVRKSVGTPICTVKLAIAAARWVLPQP